MDAGFVVDKAHGRILQQEWVNGQPEPSFWTGLKIRDKQRFTIKTFRCTHCGCLESFATEAAT